MYRCICVLTHMLLCKLCRQSQQNQHWPRFHHASLPHGVTLKMHRDSELFYFASLLGPNEARTSVAVGWWAGIMGAARRRSQVGLGVTGEPWLKSQAACFQLSHFQAEQAGRSRVAGRGCTRDQHFSETNSGMRTRMWGFSGVQKKGNK